MVPLIRRLRRRGRGLTCRETVDLVTDYLESALAPADRARFEAHLAACDGCDAYLDQVRITLGVLGRLDVESISPEARDALQSAFRTWRSGCDG